MARLVLSEVWLLLLREVWLLLVREVWVLLVSQVWLLLLSQVGLLVSRNDSPVLHSRDLSGVANGSEVVSRVDVRGI